MCQPYRPVSDVQRLRDDAPIYHNERFDLWALSRHSDVEQGLVDWRTFSNARGDILEIIQSGMEPTMRGWESMPAILR